MKYKIIILATAIIAYSHTAIGTDKKPDLNIGGGGLIVNTCTTTTCGTNRPNMMQTQNICPLDATIQKCYKAPSGIIYLVNTCTSCAAGHTLTDVPLRDIISECDVATTVKLCCRTCTACTSDNEYSASGTDGYDRKAIRTCDCNTGCKISRYTYRCAAGYYGTSTDGKTGCTRCPLSAGGTHGTSPAGKIDITSCYIPSGSFLELSGSGTYTDDCPYTK